MKCQGIDWVWEDGVMFRRWKEIEIPLAGWEIFKGNRV